MAGAPDKITADMENHPYSDYWTKEQVEARPYIYMEAHDMKGVIEDGIKVVYYVNRPYGELYDLNQDPMAVSYTHLIEEHAPNFMARINAKEELKKGAYSDAGVIVKFGATLLPDETPVYVKQGPMINKTLLDQAGPVSYTHLDVYKRQGNQEGMDL